LGSGSVRIDEWVRLTVGKTIRIAYVVTAPRQSVRLFLRGHLGFLRDSGCEVFLIAPPGKDLDEAATREGVETVPVGIERDIAPLRDITALCRLVLVLRRIRPDIVNAGTPKAGFLGMVASLVARVPVRVYHLRALRLETTNGWKYRLLTAAEKVASACATRIVGISDSLAERYSELGLASRDKIVVFGKGSSNGVEVARFSRDEIGQARGAGLRRHLGFSKDHIVVGFVGRLIPDKGIVHLFEAFGRALQAVPELRLLLVGHTEPHHPFQAGFLARLDEHPEVVRVDYQDDPSAYYHAMDVFAFPSLREGFGNVALEAAAAGLPVVGFRSTGVVDAVVDGVTGSLVPTGDVEALGNTIATYARSPRLRSDHGNAGLMRARSDFRPRTIWSAFLQEYRRLLSISRR
jgi:glycosyltransferase involved in cell wall biosynthesis